MKLLLLFRSCSGVLAFHGGPRVVDAPKAEILNRCLASLLRASENAARLFPEIEIALSVLDDHSSSDCVGRIRDQLSATPVGTKFVALPDTGNAASLRANYEHARESGADLLYFVEDDYLHQPSALAEMIHAYLDFSGATKQDVAIVPVDYPDRYWEPYPSYVLVSGARHWRTIRHTAGTFLITRKTLIEHWDIYMRFTRYGIDPEVSEDTTINRIYRAVPCFSPLPSLAAHLAGPHQVPPLWDWNRWWSNASPHQ